MPENGQPEHSSQMSHHHDHAHEHGSHDHAMDAGNERRVFWVMVLTGGFMGVEIVAGFMAGSLALLADAGHMLTDAASLGMAYAAFRVSRRPNDRRRTYGYHRFQVLAAFVNAVTLLAIVGWIAIEAVQRLFAPVQVMSGLMLVVAAVGLFVNIAGFLILQTGSKENLNLRGAALHVMGDLLGSVAAVVAALVIMGTGWMPIDPLLSLLVAALVLRSAWFILRRSAHILLEGTPEWLDLDELQKSLTAAVPAVVGVHHVHAWMLTSERPLITLHASIAPGTDYNDALMRIHRFLETTYDVSHATVQIEPNNECIDDLALKRQAC